MKMLQNLVLVVGASILLSGCLGQMLINKAEQGDVDVMRYVASCMMTGQNGYPHDKQRALYFYEKAAMYGHVTALNEVGAAYFAGEIVPQDIVKAYVMFSVCKDVGVYYFDDNRNNKYHRGDTGVSWEDSAFTRPRGYCIDNIEVSKRKLSQEQLQLANQKIAELIPIIEQNKRTASAGGAASPSLLELGAVFAVKAADHKVQGDNAVAGRALQDTANVYADVQGTARPQQVDFDQNRKKQSPASSGSSSSASTNSIPPNTAGAKNCSSAWRGNAGDHARYYCEAACADPTPQGRAYNCNTLKGFGADGKCSACN